MTKTTTNLFTSLSTTLCTALFSAFMLAGCASAPEYNELQPYNQGYSDARPAQVEAVTPKSEWMQSLTSNLSDELCADDQMFRSCYSITTDDCHQRAERVAASCETEVDPSIPAELSDWQSRRWGGSIGRCAGEQLYQTLDTTYAFTDTARCQQFLSEL